MVFLKDKKVIPKTANDVKLISAGKILENQKTVSQCRVPFGEHPGGVITMHVVVQPSLAKMKTEKKVDDSPRKSVCSCSIL
ncbi:Membrane-anchored ubiquitin-fold protein [Thalictrum thalictroides]|uniref:Membrane-anchored ubiquitin-fold protein n=1 Tax=Thalictrum thalictroides TaxID=46969 RepID=A0A7J6X706_THATH|nr:Membrane-anchored ubiquitin-fold protein [Thalictrum thalictroides]